MVMLTRLPVAGLGGPVVAYVEPPARLSNTPSPIVLRTHQELCNQLPLAWCDVFRFPRCCCCWDHIFVGRVSHNL